MPCSACTLGQVVTTGSDGQGSLLLGNRGTEPVLEGSTAAAYLPASVSVIALPPLQWQSSLPPGSLPACLPPAAAAGGTCCFSFAGPCCNNEMGTC